ncbi:MAG: hypothetical protein AB8B79_09545, partial [Granulosicoccus sp.]
CDAPRAQFERDGLYSRADDGKFIQRLKYLFSVNHSFANIRAKVNRLNRRTWCTWCTSKLPEHLADHIDNYIDVLCDRLTLLSLPMKKTAAVG